MKKIFNKISLLMAAGLVLIGMAACSDPDEPYTSLEFKKLFSPTELEAKVQNKTNVKLLWTSISNAESYTIELYADDPDMTFQGTPQVLNPSIDDIVDESTSKKSYRENSYTINGLMGETTYSVRLKAVGSGKESNWSATTFETGKEQVLQTPSTADIGKSWVKLSWPAGIQVTHISVIKSGEELLKHTLTADEIAAGTATINGLNVESTYTFYLYNGDKERGKMEVATLPNYTPVSATDKLQDAINNAADGETVMLVDNAIYTAGDNDSGDPITSLKITKNTILAANNGAILKGCNFQITEGASLEIKGLIIDGEGGSGDQAFIFKDETAVDHLIITGCEIKNFTKGFFYINSGATLVNSIIIDNCLIHHIECSGGDMFDSRSGGYNEFKLTNSTIYESAASRDFIRMDDKSSAVSATPVITIDHCTLHNVGNGDANYRLLYVRFAGNTINWTNNIVSGFVNKRGFSEQKNTAVPTFSNNCYYNTKNLVKAGDNAEQKDGAITIKFFDEGGTELTDSPFANADAGDFTVTGKAKDKEAGDPRWIK
jgi:hypothetical protein